ncbi:MAG: acyltransferase [Isosphaeraceae bacterium]
MPTHTIDAPPSSPRFRLRYLDGLRGLAALAMVLHHASMEVPEAVGGTLSVVQHALSFGHIPVDLFMVLSGYCLMLPIARAGDGRLRGGFATFLRRRAWRLLPPYYAALAVSLLLIHSVPSMGRFEGVRWDVALPAFTPGSIVSHLTLLHNVRSDWSHAINPSLWTLATDWQIYLAFPLLLALWRRAGLTLTILLAFAAGYGLRLAGFLIDDRYFNCMIPWFLGLFAQGMAAALVGFSDDARLRRAETRVPWTLLALSSLALGLAVAAIDRTWQAAYDPLIGTGFACSLIRLTRSVRFGDGSGLPRGFRCLESRWAAALGARSYSIYLVHFPLLSLIHLPMRAQGWGPSGRLLGLLMIGVPVCLAAASLFRMVFERPFLPSPPSPAGPARPRPIGLTS